MSDVVLTHIGGPTVLIEFDGWRILTDPTFDPPGRRYPFALGSSSVKTTGPALSIEEIGPIDAVLLSHDHHADNLDANGRELLASVPIVVTTESGARRLGGDTIGLRPWEQTLIHRPSTSPISITATPARHGPRFSRAVVGDATGFAVQRPHDDRVAVWMSGDSVLFSGLREVAERLDVDIALLHIGAVRFPISGAIRYTMNAAEATRLIALLDPAVAVPVHHEGWSHFSEQTRAARGGLGDSTRIRWLPLGAPVTIPRSTIHRSTSA